MIFLFIIHVLSSSIRLYISCLTLFLGKLSKNCCCDFKWIGPIFLYKTSQYCLHINLIFGHLFEPSSLVLTAYQLIIFDLLAISYNEIFSLPNIYIISFSYLIVLVGTSENIAEEVEKGILVSSLTRMYSVSLPLIWCLLERSFIKFRNF